MTENLLSTRRLSLLLLLAAALSSCGPKAVRSPHWILGEPLRYPPAQYLIGVGAAPISGGLPAALKAAGASARVELAQTIEVRIDHIQQLVDESTRVEKRIAGQTKLAMEAERSDLSSFTRTSTEQIVQGVELKEKYHDEKRGVLYVLAVLDKTRAGQRLAKEIRELDEQIGMLVDKARVRESEQDLLSAIRLHREALNRSLKAQVLQNQRRVIDPYWSAEEELLHSSGQLALSLMDLFQRYSFYTSVEGYPLIEDTIHEALAGGGFNTKARRVKGESGLTLWGTLNVKKGTFPSLESSKKKELQVCRIYLGIKIVDDRSGAIVGQVNLLDNSNAETDKLAEERTLQLLRQRILKELPGALYQALSIEME